MKKWGFLVIVVLFLGYAAARYLPDTGNLADKNDKIRNGSIRDSDSLKVVTQDQVYQGDLLLVNKQYPVHEDSVKSDIVTLSDQKDLIQGYGLLDNSIRLSESVAHTFNKMIKAAEKDGVNHFLISSGYRDFEEQEQLYEEKGSDYALPAQYSEHNLGLSLDIGSSQSEMSKAAEGKWLEKNAWKYGFILRYPKDKTEITGIKYEPWHFRYVGLPHSAIIHEKGIVLEQYLDLLKENSEISTVVDGKTYTVSYYPVSGYTSIKIPKEGQYKTSGDNMDGVIVTTFR
ncbi:M15 family metallopeptidase [Paenibacillus sp. G2S3]|uniref:M15 family metallopeptidase n=1 Tax=Paenibacillus sp. G2S3 TaxID=3047872 RepID=UPI0024C1DB94|nr:M15 family metallopeptidase [Paenibacillus sp. G2S3]WHY19325.1 M15 family metallopeptidase [Paenibacillus sp. G2S3]